ncbi:MAG: 3-ketoacyl-ACP reductase [Spirochaetales bacterium]|nr:3-ketoacyl-ACP reductase [Spirochaetales bacterium]
MAPTVLVTGGSRGIGRGLCIELAKKGWSVAINYAENQAAAVECMKLCRIEAKLPTSQEFGIFRADISKSTEIDTMLTEISNTMGPLTALVNNAGIAPKERMDLLEMTRESFDHVLDINLRGAFFLSQKVASGWVSTSPPNTETSPRKIIFVSSISAETVSLNRGEYCISKAGISMAAKLFAVRLAPENIFVYEVRPGIIKTDMTSGVVSKYDGLIENGLVPQKRWGLPEDIGRTVSGLLSDNFNFSTGSVIPVDGGLSIPIL